MAHLAPLLDSPALPNLVERLQRTLDEEAERRAAFRDALTPDQKAEFINGETIVHSPALARHTAATPVRAAFDDVVNLDALRAILV